MAIRRNNGTPRQAQFSVGLNVILTGSKKMTPQQQDTLLTVGQVRVLIVDADNENQILVDEIADAREFSTGSVGYGLNLRNQTFKQIFKRGEE